MMIMHQKNQTNPFPSRYAIFGGENFEKLTYPPGSVDNFFQDLGGDIVR
jgi:hypothetical protein